MSQHRPEIDSATAGFWRAAAEGRLVGSRCLTCGEVAGFPRGFCPYCWSENVAEVDLSGRATLYTYSVVHTNPAPPFHDLVPYVAAIVELEEGPRFTTRLVDVDFDELRIGMPLTARFEALEPDEGVILFGPPT